MVPYFQSFLASSLGTFLFITINWSPKTKKLLYMLGTRFNDTLNVSETTIYRTAF